MLLLSIATVEHWLAVDGVGSLSTIFTLCAFVFACECAVCLPVSVSLVYLRTKRSKTLFVWLTPSLWKPRTRSKTVRLCLLLSPIMKSSLSLVGCEPLEDITTQSVYNYLYSYFCNNTFVVLMRMNKVWILISLALQNLLYKHYVQDCTQLPSFNQSCTCTQETNYCRWCCIYL